MGILLFYKMTLLKRLLKQEIVLILIISLSAIDAKSEGVMDQNIPRFFQNRFENMVPSRIGDTLPNLKISVECNPTEGCNIDLGNGSVLKAKAITMASPDTMKAAQVAL